jgi:hypothetical protein
MSGEGRSEAVVYQCVYRDRGLTPGCAAFDQRKRARCAGCRSGVRAVRRHAVLVAWRGDGRYTLGDALATFRTYAAAEREAARLYEIDNRSDVVARFLPVAVAA